MKNSKQDDYIQCVDCGRIHKANIYKLKDDTIYVDCYCPYCNGSKGLYIGNNELDIYMLYDHTLDNRYYMY